MPLRHADYMAERTCRDADAMPYATMLLPCYTLITRELSLLMMPSRHADASAMPIR